MDNCALHHLLKTTISELMEVQVVYGYMIQNAPTEEARRIIEQNRKTVMNTLKIAEDLYEESTGDMVPPMNEFMEEIPIFADFVAAARYAFIEETQLIRLVKQLYLMADSCTRDTLFSILIEHILNAMRLLYLIA